MYGGGGAESDNNVSGGAADVSGSLGGDGDEQNVIGGVDSEQDVVGGVGAGAGPNSVGGGNVSGSGGVNVSPIPLIPRRRLREILEHAQGECIICSFVIVCI